MTVQFHLMNNIRPLPQASNHNIEFIRGLISRCLVHPKSLENHDMWKKLEREQKKAHFYCLFQICNSAPFNFDKLSLMDEATQCMTCQNESLKFCVQITKKKGRWVRVLELQ